MTKQIITLLFIGYATGCAAAHGDHSPSEHNSRVDLGLPAHQYNIDDKPLVYQPEGKDVLFMIPHVNKTLKAAIKADKTGDFTEHQITVEGKPLKVTSYFNLSKDTDLLVKMFTPHVEKKSVDVGGTWDLATEQKTKEYDLRAYEKRIRQLAMQSRRFPARFRGTIGLAVGLAVGGAAAYECMRRYRYIEYLKEGQPSFKGEENLSPTGQALYEPLYAPDKISYRGEFQEGPLYWPENK